MSAASDAAVNALLPSQFESASIVVAAINETTSLEETVAILEKTCRKEDIKEVILAISPRSTPECKASCEKAVAASGLPVRILVQVSKGPGGAYQDAFRAATGSHVVLMASDLETHPPDVARMIEASKETPRAVICTSRWIAGGGFKKGYNPVKYVLNFIFQKMMATLFGVRLTDLTFGFRLLPTRLTQGVAWEELFHPFFLETIIKPLRLGVPSREISTTWEPRVEGESQNSFFRNFIYLRIAWRTRFRNPEEMLLSNAK